MNNWDIALAVFFVLEKLVKLSPTKYDDILLQFNLSKNNIDYY